MGRKTIDRTGEENYNSEGTLMRIVEYKNNNNIIVEFQDEYKTKVHTQYNHFKNGNVKNPFYKSIFGIGYIGEGKYKTRENYKLTKAYGTWHCMLQRCYEPYTINKHLTYIDCYVCDEWLCFQNFAEWYEENMYECNNECMELDKDILIKGNKIYSCDTCLLVPQRINTLFIKCDAKRGNLPVGVCWNKATNKFCAHCNIIDKENKKINLGYYNTIEEAFLAYKNFKENYIKEVADEYKDLIPQKLYDALYSYEVEIND